MKPVLIIGWGNPLRGDDGLGWRAAERLAQLLDSNAAVVRVAHQLMPEFAEEISRSEVVIFIDAACDNETGELRFERVEPRSSPSAPFSHQLDPAALLNMARTLYGLCPDAYLFTVAGRSFGFGEELSPEVRATLPALLEEVEKVCGRSIKAASHS
jgi:hydrogenase maturation protease